MVAGATALAAGLSLSGSVTATAAAPTAVIKTTVWAPSCVKVIKQDKEWGVFPRVTIRNDCSTSQRVKIIWAWAPDSSCQQLGVGQTYRHSTGAAGQFDGIARC